MPEASKTFTSLHSTFTKKFAVCASTFLLILLLAGSQLSVVVGQSPSPASALDKAQNDYTFQYTKYRDAQDKYLTAKETYNKFQTAVAKNDAFVKTKDYLLQVDQLYITFIGLTQETTNSINWGKSTSQKDAVAATLKEEISYLTNHKQKIQNTKTLEELPPLATELKTHIKETAELRLNKVFATFEVVETESALGDFTILSQILDRVVVFKLRAGETKSILANWASEIKDIRDKTTQKITPARTKLDETKEDTMSKNALEDITETAQSAKKELKRSKPLFEEVARIL